MYQVCSVYARTRRRYSPHPRQAPAPQTIKHTHPRHRTFLQPTFDQVLALPLVTHVSPTSSRLATILGYYFVLRNLELRITKQRNFYKIWKKILRFAGDSKRVRALTSWIVLTPRTKTKRSNKGKNQEQSRTKSTRSQQSAWERTELRPPQYVYQPLKLITHCEACKLGTIPYSYMTG